MTTSVITDARAALLAPLLSRRTSMRRWPDSWGLQLLLECCFRLLNYIPCNIDAVDVTTTQRATKGVKNTTVEVISFKKSI